MRRFALELHRSKSDNLAQGSKDQGTQLLAYEKQLSALKNKDLRIAPDFLTTLEQASKLPQNEALSSALLQELNKVFPEIKFNRPDRHWDQGLLHEGLRHGWRVWKVEASLNLKDVEKFNRLLGTLLIPKGFILFTEAKGIPKTHFTGRWYCILHRSIKKSKDLPPELRSFPWRLIFSYKELLP